LAYSFESPDGLPGLNKQLDRTARARKERRAA
jgi:hypothetical protein